MRVSDQIPAVIVTTSSSIHGPKSCTGLSWLISLLATGFYAEFETKKLPGKMVGWSISSWVVVSTIFSYVYIPLFCRRFILKFRQTFVQKGGNHPLHLGETLVFLFIVTHLGLVFGWV